MLINCIFLILFLFASCSFPESSKRLTAEECFDRERSKVVHRALKKFIKNMEAKGYRAAGFGEGLDHSTPEKEKQNYLAVTFDIESLPDVDFARKIEVEALQEFLCYINSEEGIQDYVAEYPYPVKFMRISFISRNPHKGLCSVANCREEIYYCIDESENPYQGPLIDVHRESYQDAIRILEQKVH